MEAKVFDINEELQKTGREIDLAEQKNKSKSINSFTETVNKVNNYLESTFEGNDVSDEEKEAFLEKKHQAIIGDSQAQTEFEATIEGYLRENNLLGVSFPDFYWSLQEAIYHEIFRFGVFYKWESYKGISPSAEISGDEIWFKIDGVFQRQEERLRNEDHIYEIIRSFQYWKKGLKINEATPEAEIEMKDGTRVTIMIPPRVYKPTIVFRRFIVDEFTFAEQARRNTISKDDIRFFQSLSRLQLSTVIAGPVESAKSTFLKTIYGERDPNLSAILMESSPETYLKRDFPSRHVRDVYTLNDDINKVIYKVLRMDHDYLIMQEVRGFEAEGAMQATERGRDGLLLTYHISNPQRTVEQLAQHITDEFPNRNHNSQKRRVAQNLDVGIIMNVLDNNRKVMNALYEVCYDPDTDAIWINYLVKFNKDEDKWEYNSAVSEGLQERLKNKNKELASYVLNHLQEKEKESPMNSEPVQNVRYKE